MSSEILEKVIRCASEYETVWFIWHGGEPLTVPLNFYKNVIKLQEKYFGKDSHRISNTIQTNGILIDKKLMNFCEENKINVGVSFEGPCNNVLREKGELVQKNLDMMKKEGHMFSVSSTICKDTVKQQSALYDHFIGNGMALSLSPVICLGSATPDMIPDPDDHASVNIELFDKWLNDTNATVPLMPHMMYLLSALGEPTPADCAHSSCITKWISIYPNGDVYPCAKGCPSEFKLCNISDTERISDAFLSENLKKLLIPTIERREKCRSECSIFEYCNGGCSIDALSEGSMENNNGNSCKIFRKLFTHILATTERILKERPDLSQYNKFAREALIGKLMRPE